MQKQNILYSEPSFGFGPNLDRQFGTRIPHVAPRISLCTWNAKCCLVPITKKGDLLRKTETLLEYGRIKAVGDGNSGELSDEDDDLCPVECVREFKTDEEFFEIIEKAKENDALVVVDFYRRSCGSCKYIEQGFAKLCRAAGDEAASVIFLKHNVIDEYDEQSEVAERLRIKTVPLFHFYKGGVLLEAFATRDKERIDAAILKYTTSASASQPT
ncbi:thioredoxin-like 4, chloroplastic [Euphorbia lathyris]|uniref:thioredoxin-like 4, chloroplastic n=1 Tax=Euphorbia lathyris TaxID=212925 RepID=UPI0033135BE4